jgi:nicotinate-nucleotide adenylyltransferase
MKKSHKKKPISRAAARKPQKGISGKRTKTTARKKTSRGKVAPIRFPIPIASPGMRIGLFGGSFNPPHEAHRAASMLALKRLNLDRVWWLVTPGNPLKKNSTLPPLEKRIAAAREVAASPLIEVTGLEAELGTRFSYDTVTRLRQRMPGVAFVFVVGADNLAQFHRWERWRELAGKIPIAVIDRPEFELSSLAAPAAVAFAKARVPDHAAPALAGLPPPAWVFLRGLKSELSSTTLRKVGTKKKRKG